MPVYFDSNRIGDTLAMTIKHVITAPRDFFADLPPSDAYRDSLLFLTIVLVVLALGFSLMSGLMLLPLIVPFTLVFGLITTWLWAWYLSWACRVFCKLQLSTANAFQICAYGAVPMMFSWLPIFGVLASLWNLYLNWQGLVSHAKVGGGSALLIIFLPLVILGLSMAVLLVLVFQLMADMGIEPSQLIGTDHVELF
ncbi:MAG: YIP1 family protein [Mariprofundaceae bacterium]